MKIYLVGGAVRDQLLGLPVQERDWVVVGGTPEMMTAQGFRPVGKEFPVFLHPKTHEEYALARTERKVGKGYKGFTFYTAPDISLADDLKRRDLTINAIAQAETGELIDPYHGQEDLKNKILRHVSPAFQEDPVRILRLARFASRFYDFSIHPETMQLMRAMVQAGEVNALVPERVWQEWSRALLNERPIRFFEVLEQCGALPILFPELCWNNAAKQALIHATALSSAGTVRLAALLHETLPSAMQQLTKRYRFPNPYADLALLVSRYLSDYQNSLAADAKTLLQTIMRLDILRRPQRFEEFALACQASSPNITTEHFAHMQKAVEIIHHVRIEETETSSLSGPEIAEKLQKERLKALQAFLLQM